MNHAEALNLSGPENEPEVLAAQTEPEEWSFSSGAFDPENFAQQPQPERLVALRDEVKVYPESAKIRFWALGVLNYGVELSNPAAMGDEEMSHQIAQAINEKFAKAAKAAISDIPLQSGDSAVVEKWPVYKAAEAALRADPELAGKPALLAEIQSFITRILLSN